MNWKQQYGQRYLYCSRRCDGVGVTDYLGTGKEAEALFEEDQQRRAAEAAHQAARSAGRGNGPSRRPAR